FGSGFGFLEVTRRERWTVRAVRQLALLRRDYRADPLRPAQIVELRQTAGAVKDEIVLQRHVPDGDAPLGDERQVAIRSPDRKQPHQTRIDLCRGEPMKVTVIPIQPLRHVPRDVVGVGVRHLWSDVQHDIVGISPRADVSSMRVKIYWRRGHLLRVEGNGLIFKRVSRNEVIPDGQAGEAVFEMDDQPFARKYLESGCWIEVAAGLLPVGCRATDPLVAEKEKVLDRGGYCIERCLALPCGEPNFEHAVLARQHDGLSELRPGCEIGFLVQTLRDGSRAGPYKRHRD